MPVYTRDDNDKDTAWTDAVVGAKLIFAFPKKLPEELERTRRSMASISRTETSTPIPRSSSTDAIKKVRLFYNGRAFADVELADTRAVAGGDF